MDDLLNSAISSVPLNASNEVSSNLISGVSSKKHTLQVLIDQWKAIDLDGKRNELDAQAAEIADNKDANVAFRKKLAEQTKNFRKNTDDEKLKNFGSLLKAYQEEIDRLTRRCKFAENSFLSTYKSLAEAPDPVKGLTAALDESQKSSRVGELELENRKLKTELEEFRKEFQEIKNQEVTIRRLEDKVQEYEQKMDAMIEERVKGSERHFQDEKQKTIDQLIEREQEARRSFTQIQEDYVKVQHSLEVTQTDLFDLRSKFDDELSGKQAELDMMAEELERTRLRAAHLEREKERLAENSDRLGQSPLLHQSRSSPDLELEAAQKDIEISQLREHIQLVEQSKNNEIVAFKKELNSLKDQLEAERGKANQYLQEMKNKPSDQEFHNLKNQLEIFKRALEYTDDDSTSSVDDGNRTIERLLKDKNKKLETELIQYKGLLSEREKEVKEIKEKLANSVNSAAELKQLVIKLEEDIAKGNVAGVSSEPSKSMVEEILAQPKSLRSSTTDDNASMLQIVCNQRDRFKARIRDMEQETKELHHKLELKDSEIDSLRNDNIKLYEKIRFLSSYGNNNQQGRGSVVVDIGGKRSDDEVDSKYSQLYEETVNPFVLFNRKERYQRYKNLNAAEKVILSSGRFFLSTKYSRTFLFFYSMLLHVLVFVTTYKLASGSSTTTID